MSYESTCTVVSDYLKTNFTAYPLVPENRPFQPAAGQVWVRFGMRPADEFATEVQGKTERVIGYVWFQIFVPENTGAKEAQKVGDALVGLFFQKTLTATGKPSVICEAAKLRYVGQDESGYQQWSVTVPYRVDATVS